MTRLDRSRFGAGGDVRAVTSLVIAVVVVGVVVGCGVGARPVPIPSEIPTATLFLSDAAQLTRLQVESALRGRNLTAIVPQVPFRPGESPALAAAPRLIVQAILPGDSNGGFIVVYDFRDAPTAYAAGVEMANYLASGPGRVQFLPDTRHVLRELGSTLVFFSWSPSTSPDPHTADIAGALETLGTEIPIRP